MCEATSTIINMKYYSLVHDKKVNGLRIPAMNGGTVTGHETFFKDGCTIDSFYQREHEFDYLTPMNVSEFEDPPELIADYHTWIRKEPRKGYFKPISKKYKELLECYNLAPHKFYMAKVLFEGKRHPYFVMHLLYNSYHGYIDFDKTRFNNLNSFQKLEFEKLEVKQFSTYKTMEAYSDAEWNYCWNFERLVMKPAFRAIDYCYMDNIDGDLVSERLKNVIEKAGITGVKFAELTIPIEFSDNVL